MGIIVNLESCFEGQYSQNTIICATHSPIDCRPIPIYRFTGQFPMEITNWLGQTGNDHNVNAQAKCEWVTWWKHALVKFKFHFPLVENHSSERTAESERRLQPIHIHLNTCAPVSMTMAVIDKKLHLKKKLLLHRVIFSLPTNTIAHTTWNWQSHRKPLTIRCKFLFHTKMLVALSKLF